ncbi:MAG: LysM peptidoglycan-binding domain-containing protein [Candidatus Fusobacterium pullicola]|uniref:LysM peptidoglycan-binding domain-containing protein n=1 Tax=Candidatus Fusobacterium pullicola TaxID=2838601 RepID=A0A9E2L0R5_9FUSO|nr:LysM peptidoglycan-binding domain-containing protein [Candidatus Fusobacterium pullicola]
MLLKNGYAFYIDGVLFPITPQRMNIKFKNRNRTVTLVNEGEFNILKESGLQEISFDACIPAVKYPFAQYLGGIFLPIVYYIELIKKLKNSKKPFNFVIIREGSIGVLGYSHCMKVSLEDFQIKEDADEGRDVIVSLNLKEYKDSNRAIVSAISGGLITTTKVRDSASKTIAKTYTVKAGDTLYNIAKKELGNGSRYLDLKTLNNLANANSIKVGQVLRLE